MSSQSQPAEKNRRRRQPRNKTGSNDLAATDEGTSLDESSANPSSRSGRARKNVPPSSESALTQQIRQAASSTPPRPNNSRRQPAHDAGGPNGQKNGRRKNTGQNETQVTSPGPKKVSMQHAGASTPSKPNIEAYAGPTFHASPAPSTLPIPKFFSKSAPPTDHDVGITARLQQDDPSGSSSSEEAPDSPSRRTSAKSPTTGKNATPAPALFNMLLNADRQEKARQRADQGSGHGSDVSLNETGPNKANGQRLSHNRTLTAGSVFPIDMDASSGRSTPASVNNQAGNPVRQGSPAYNNVQRPHTSVEDGNLKRMLFSSPQQSVPAGQTQYSSSGGPLSSPAWASSPASHSNASPYGTPPSASSINGLAASSRPAPVSPYTQASPSPVARRAQYPSQNNSGLRREVSPGQLNLQGTPPQFPAYGYYDGQNARNSSPLGSPIAQRHSTYLGNSGHYSPYGSHGYNSPARNHSPGAAQTSQSTTRFSAQDALKASLGKDQSTGSFNVASMEDELRKVLRIGQLRATSAAAPQN